MIALFTDIGYGVIGMCALVAFLTLGLIAQAIADRRKDRQQALDLAAARHPSARRAAAHQTLMGDNHG